MCKDPYRSIPILKLDIVIIVKYNLFKRYIREQNYPQLNHKWGRERQIKAQLMAVPKSNVYVQYNSCGIFVAKSYGNSKQPACII